IAGDRFEVGGGGVLELPGAPGQSHHGAVRLELREAHLQGLACSGEVEAIQEVDGHVRGGAEGRAQRVGAPRGREATDSTDRESKRGPASTTAWPSVSMPRRPARPVSWVYSPGVRSTCSIPL